MLTLTKQAAKISHLNLREEKHGEETVLALDIKISFDMQNAYLEDLKPGLKASFYGAAEGATADMLDRGHLPRLLHPEIGEIKFAAQMLKCPVTIFYEKKKVDILGDVNNFKLHCKDGGTVSTSLRVQILPSPEEAGVLAGLLGLDVKVTIQPGEEQAPAGEEAPE